MADRPAWVTDACTLPTVEQPLRVAEFDELFAASLRGVQRVSPTLARLVLDPGAEGSIRELAARETQCCSFFDFVITPTAATVEVEIAVPAARRDVLDRLVGRAEGLIS